MHRAFSTGHKPPAGVSEKSCKLPSLDRAWSHQQSVCWIPLNQCCQNKLISGKINSISNRHSTRGKARAFDSHLQMHPSIADYRESTSETTILSCVYMPGYSTWGGDKLCPSHWTSSQIFSHKNTSMVSSEAK